jgi:dipeptidyl aminopeptidase/acylaminoacyl peptidase
MSRQREETGKMSETAVAFESNGVELVGTIRVPDTLKPGEKRPAFIVMHGFGSTSSAGNVLQPCAILEKLGYVTLCYDQRGCGRSGGPRGHLIMQEQVIDARHALELLARHENVAADRIGMLGSSFGAAVSIYTAGIDSRVAAVVSASGFGHGQRKFRGQHKSDAEWSAFTQMLDEGKRHRERTGESLMVDRYAIVPIPSGLRTHVLEGSIQSFTADTAQSIFDFNPEDVIGDIAPRPVLLMHSTSDSVTPVEQALGLFGKSKSPTDLFLFAETDHFMFAEHNVRVRRVLEDWLEAWFPAQGEPAPRKAGAH